jgi:hypothetical protein
MFYNCQNLESVGNITLPSSDTANLSYMFGLNPKLANIGTGNCSVVNNFGSIFSNCFSLRDCDFTNMKYSISFASCKLSKTTIDKIFTNLGKAFNTSQAITITGNYGLTSVSKTGCTLVSGSTTVTKNDTSSLAVGMYVTATSVDTMTGITSNVTTNLFTKTNHGIPNGTPIAFSALSTTTGITTYTVYYVVNAAASTFQIELAPGSGPIDLTGTNGTNIAIIYPNEIMSINPNVSFTLKIPASAAGSNVTVVATNINRSVAKLKGWTITA